MFNSAKLINGATATGVGTVLLDARGGRIYGLQVVATGSPTGLVVNLEGTLNGVNWVSLGSWDITAPLTSGAIVFVVDKPVMALRANLATLSGGTSPTVNAWGIVK